MTDKLETTFIIEIKVTIGDFAYRKGEATEPGQIISACDSTNRIKIKLQDGYYWEGPVEDFNRLWDTQDIPF